MMSIFSGEDSKKYWDAVNTAITRLKGVNILYRYGVIAQNIEKENIKLRANNKRLRDKIKIVCVGLDAPKFDPTVSILDIDLNEPENAYLRGWETALLECGEILSRP